MRAAEDLRTLLGLRELRRLFAVRMVSQSGDGMFQVGLATLFFFSPESQGTAASIAVAFAVLLAPFTLVGPWAGVLLDRWRRRRVLVVSNLLRAVLAVTVALIVLRGGAPVPVYVLALCTLSVNRFLLATLSASLPRVVDGPLLLTANAIVPTLGAGAAGVGGVLGLLLGLAVPVGAGRDAASLGAAAVLFAVAALLALGFSGGLLGPDVRGPRAPVRRQLGELGSGLVEGARALVALRTPAQALLVMAAHRFLFGVMFVSSILVSRNLLGDDAAESTGLGTFALVLGATAAGFAVAVVLSPVLAARYGPQAWVTVCLLLGCAAQALLAVHLDLVTMLVGAVALGLSAQGAKIAVDTVVQRDTPDRFRGRAFALYDVLYNAAFVGAAAVAALVLPDTGYSVAAFASLAITYAVLAVVYGRWCARTARTTEG